MKNIVEGSARRARSMRRAALATGLTAAVLLPVLVSAGSGSAAAPPPAHPGPTGPNTVGLKTVGPIDETNGFPLWYKDTSGQRLELCLDANDPYCIMGAVPTPGQPLVFPTNFPDEAFWSMADSTLATDGGGGSAILVTGLEAAFAADVAPGQQISFGRIRLRVAGAGLQDGATYTITHPFGVDTAVAGPGQGNAAGVSRQINVTEDIGDLAGGSTFEAALGSRPAPFLKWDPTIAPAAPLGHLGDPTVDHEVTGSPYGTNIFRIEGPAGSFTGSPNLCADPALGDSTTATDDCIETNLFTVMGKTATRAGVQVTKAVTTKDGAGNLIDVFAKSEPGQTLVITGTGVAATAMREDGNGGYYGRIRVDGDAPADLAVTNTTDNPTTVDHVEQFGDKVHVNSAIYDNDTKSLIVLAQSGDPAATLTLTGYPSAVQDTSGTSQRFTVSGLNAPPADVMVTSSKGGSDGDDVVIAGAAFTAQQVVAAITADATEVSVGQKVTLDGTGSTGTILSYAWTQTSGPAQVTLTNTAQTSFTPTVAGPYTFKLTVTGTGAGNTSSDTVTINAVGSAAPVANAGPNQLNVAPTSTVTLNGSASTFAASYTWTAPAGITLSRTDVANPTFIAPASSTPQTLTFSLTVKDAAGLQPSTATVTVTTDPDDLSVDSASFKRGGAEWRIRGTAQYCSANNAVTFSWNKPGSAPVVLGTQTPTLAAGVCSFDFRLKNAPAAAQPTAAGTITVTSVMGGRLPNQTFVFG